MTLDEGRFATLADETIDRLMAGIEAGCGDRAEVDLEGGILTVEIEDGGKYVLNKHAPMRQLWLASPASGAWHFTYDETAGAWRSTRGAETLEDVLGRDLGIDLAGNGDG